MAEADAGDSSPSSVDALIRDIIAGRRSPDPDAAERILERMRQSTFSLARRNIPAPLQELMRQHGYPVPDPGNDLVFHWAKHVLGDAQWVSNTTPEQYVQDALNAVDHPSSRLYVQAGPGGRDVAVVVAMTADVVPPLGQGSRSGTYLVVVYSIVLDRIVSVYMTNSLTNATTRSGTVWLRG